MADTAKDTAAALGLGDSSIAQLLSTIQTASAAKEKAVAPLRAEELKSMQQGREEEKKLFEQIPTYNPPPAPNQQNYQTDPLKAFGSFGSIFGILASALTHTPMTNALNASAAAVNAIKANDQEGFKTAYDVWKTNTDVALQRHNAALKEWDDIRARNKDNFAGYEAEMRAYGAKWDDKIALAQLEAGLITNFDKVQAARAMAANRVQEASDRIANEVERTRLYAKALNERQNKVSPSQAKAAMLVRQGQSVEGKIDDDIKWLDQHKWAVGAIGTGHALIEKITGNLPGEEERKAIANEWNNRIADLRLRSINFLTSSRPLKFSAQNIETLLPKVSPEAPYAVVRDALVKTKGLIHDELNYLNAVPYVSESQQGGNVPTPPPVEQPQNSEEDFDKAYNAIMGGP